MNESFERLFFALWPSKALREEIVQAYDGLGKQSKQGRRVRISNLHMTLHFLGNIALDRVDCFIEQARQVKSAPFELELTHIGHFKKARVAWLGCATRPQRLMQLHRRLAEQIRLCGYSAEERRYTPHVTMARKARGPAEPVDIEPISWSVDRFVLVKSESVEDGVQYRVKASFPLHG